MTPEDSNTFFQSHIDPPVMAILRGYSPQQSAVLSTRAREIGIALIEIPVQSNDAIEALARTVHEIGGTGPVGAGTVTTIDRVRQAVRAGAAFTVAPGFDAEVARASLDAGMPHLPGVASATEVQQAAKHGLTWMKAFPAAELTAGWLSAMHGPFPEARFVATGGISLTNAGRFLGAGASIVSFGSALADPAQADGLSSFIASLHV